MINIDIVLHTNDRIIAVFIFIIITLCPPTLQSNMQSFLRKGLLKNIGNLPPRLIICNLGGVQTVALISISIYPYNIHSYAHYLIYFQIGQNPVTGHCDCHYLQSFV